MKSRAFSIFLLKKGYDATNALKADHTLDSDIAAAALPAGASLFVLDAVPKQPWWKDYFGIGKDLRQGTKGALVILPVDERTFALSFGHVAHNLKDDSYEYDFGIRVTLNAVDPKKLKNTDTLEPGAARRQKTQVAIDSDLTYFDFDRDTKILKSLTGKVKAEYRDLMKDPTGSSHLRINSSRSAGKLIELCRKLLGLYTDETFKTTFPDIGGITPVRDPAIVEQLDARLVEAVRTRAVDLYLAVPTLLDYEEALRFTFEGKGQGLMYNDVFLDRYYEYLAAERAVDLAALTLQDLKNHSLKVTDENGAPRKGFSVFRSLIFDTTEGGTAYHLIEGNWYRVEKGYLEKIAARLDPYCRELGLPDYNHLDEGDYNEKVAAADPKFVCLDRTDISPSGQTQVEPCDLYGIEDGRAAFRHVKVSTFSADLSHLFNQGLNALELVKGEDEARQKLRKAIIDRGAGARVDELMGPVNAERLRVVFAMVTHKDPAQKSGNLPLFSRISLMRTLKQLRLMDVDALFGFVADKRQVTAGKKKPKKANAATAKKAVA